MQEVKKTLVKMWEDELETATVRRCLLPAQPPLPHGWCTMGWRLWLQSERSKYLIWFTV